MVDKYAGVFNDDLGRLPGIVHLEVDPDHTVLTTVIRQGWPELKEGLPNVVAPYFNIRDEMSIQDGLVFKGERMVIPQTMRSKMLGKVHNSHVGVNGCLNRARECLY